MGRSREQVFRGRPDPTRRASLCLGAGSPASLRGCWGTLGGWGGNHSPVVDGPTWELESVPARKKGQGESVQVSQLLRTLSKCGDPLTTIY